MPNAHHTAKRTAPKASGSQPTSAQLNYLRTLAATTGTSFAYPATKAEASREIARLEKLTGRIDRRLVTSDARRDRAAISRELNRGYGTGIDHEDTDALEPTPTRSEIAGWGSSAHWA